MNKGKTHFGFKIQNDKDNVDSIIKNWLAENNFSFVNKYGEDLYYCYDKVMGNRGFQYNIVNNEVNIYAWTIGFGNKFYMLDSGAFNNMPGDTYKNLLTDLFARLSHGSVEPNTVSNNNQTPTVSQVAKELDNNISNSAEKMCDAGFWLSLFGLFCALIGVTYAAILYAVNIYFISQGLKTNKRKKAIISLVLTVISIILVILSPFIG